MKRVIKHVGVKGDVEMARVGWEAAHAKNTMARRYGYSPMQLVFGKEPRVPHELYSNGESYAAHIEARDPRSKLIRTFQVRAAAKEAFVKQEAQGLLDRSIRGRNRPLARPAVGDNVFFYREKRQTKSRKRPISGWVGPSLVVGFQGDACVWVSYGGRCYLVANEHCREVIGGE
jgi:hypothetical protein